MLTSASPDLRACFKPASSPKLGRGSRAIRSAAAAASSNGAAGTKKKVIIVGGG